jgi:hypothetical protein
MILSRFTLCFLAAAAVFSVHSAQLAHAAVGDQLAKFRPENPTSFDAFGNSVAIDGNTIIVGAPGDDSLAQNAGAAYFYNATTGSLIRKFYANDGTGLDRFGGSVGISGNTAIVGAFDDADIGSAYLFDVASGTQIAKLAPSDGAFGDGFGTVAIDGTRAIVGAAGDDDRGQRSGSAYIFDAVTGAQLAKLVPSDGQSSANFGISVDISGNVAIIGANDDEVRTINSGSAYLFNVTTGAQIAKLIPNDANSSSDFFGAEVAIRGNIAIVGVPNDDDKGLQSGSAYLFDVATGQQIAKLLAIDGVAGDQFGSSVAIHGNTAIIGAWGDDDKATESGAAYLFDIPTRMQIAKLVAGDLGSGDRFGGDVAISGNLSIVSAHDQDFISSGTGAAYLFDATNPVPEPNGLIGIAITCAMQSWFTGSGADTPSVNYRADRCRRRTSTVVPERCAQPGCRRLGTPYPLCRTRGDDSDIRPSG